LRALKTRNEFADLLNEMGLVGFAAEIGVAEGGFSFFLLDRWPGTAYQIDPWIEPDPFDFQENIPAGEQERRYQLVLSVAKKYRGRAIPKRMTSAEAAPCIEDETLCFVYIDANHNYEHVREDLALWWPKVRSGGIFAGHDYLEGLVGGVEYGVKHAVTEFAAEHGLEVNVIPEEWPSWWIIRP
jgi:hypothetical protein